MKSEDLQRLPLIVALRRVGDRFAAAREPHRAVRIAMVGYELRRALTRALDDHHEDLDAHAALIDIEECCVLLRQEIRASRSHPVAESLRRAEEAHQHELARIQDRSKEG